MKNKRISDVTVYGDDFIFGGRGHDTIMSTNGNDVIYSGAGNDNVLVVSRDGEIFVDGGLGDDALMIVGENLVKWADDGYTFVTDDTGLWMMIENVEKINLVDL